MTVQSFKPVVAPNARVLILGTMPSVASLRAGQYYGHPRNAFWRIMAVLCGLDPAGDYAERLAALQAAGLALWDVLAACERPGSLDASIVTISETPNDVIGLLTDHPLIRLIALNGQKAAQLWRRHIWPQLLPAQQQQLTVEALPSTSPAYIIPLAAKVTRWCAVITPFLVGAPCEIGSNREILPPFVDSVIACRGIEAAPEWCSYHFFAVFCMNTDRLFKARHNRQPILILTLS